MKVTGFHAMTLSGPPEMILIRLLARQAVREYLTRKPQQQSGKTPKRSNHPVQIAAVKD